MFKPAQILALLLAAPIVLTVFLLFWPIILVGFFLFAITVGLIRFSARCHAQEMKR